MKNIKLLTGLVMGLIFIYSQTLAQDPTAKLDKKPLYVYGDSVRFEATINVPPHRVMRKDGYYRIMPELGDTKFPEIHIPSSELQNARKEGIKVTISSSAPFNEDMIGNDLEIEHEYVYRDGEKNKEFDDMDDLAECCLTTGMLFSLNGQYELMNFEYTPPKSTPLKVVAQINFPINISEFSVNEQQEKIKVIGDYLKAHPDATITIRGFASPEGPVERNKELARERAQAAKEWLTKALNEKGYKNSYNENAIKVETTSEDWRGLVQLIRNSNLSTDKQTEIMNAISTNESLKKMEEKLYEIVGDKQKVEEFMRPLRRTTIVASSRNAFREGYTRSQIDQINTRVQKGEIPASALKDIYNQEEYLQAYVQNDAREGKITLLTSYVNLYPGDMRIYSDLGAHIATNLHSFDVVGGDDALVGVGFNRDVVDIDEELDIDEGKFKYKYKYKQEDVEDPEKFKIKIKGDVERLKEAKKYFDKAVEVESNNFVALNNLGAWYLTNGDYTNAEQLLEKSYKLNPNQDGVNYNLGVLHAVRGEYEKAHRHFEKAEGVPGIGYNRGLARYMVGDYMGAQQDFMQFSKDFPQYALGHYLTAVAAAKTGEKELMLEKLKMAIKRIDRLADIAEEDLAFRAYWDNDAFEDASDDDVAEN
ncbi:MAG: tetratricopeptide repeat protein [Candidatus Cyclobacteriaceae bacterium M2_1C_046]